MKKKKKKKKNSPKTEAKMESASGNAITEYGACSTHATTGDHPL
jgi:hypothetical protein